MAGAPPRNPKDLQALLKFCMQATKAEDAPELGDDALARMDPEKKAWLETALRDMTVNVFQELTKGIQILSDENVVSNPDAESLEPQLEAFECIEDWVGQVDMANNFHKLGGFTALRLCLDSPHDEVVSGACHVVAELAQNNPYCQENFTREGFIPLILKLISNDEKKRSDGVKAKAIYAVSSVTRDCPTALAEFKKLDGLSVILRALENSSGKERLRTKCCFFLSSLMESDADTKSVLADLDLQQLLIAILGEEHDPSHEHVAKCLLVLLKDNRKVLEQVLSLDVDLKGLLNRRIEELRDKEEFLEERDYCTELLKLCYPSGKDTVVR